MQSRDFHYGTTPDLRCVKVIAAVAQRPSPCKMPESELKNKHFIFSAALLTFSLICILARIRLTSLVGCGRKQTMFAFQALCRKQAATDASVGDAITCRIPRGMLIGIRHGLRAAGSGTGKGSRSCVSESSGQISFGGSVFL